MGPVASSARDTYFELANLVNIHRIAQLSRLLALATFIRHEVKYKQIQNPSLKSDMLHMEKVLYSEVSAGVFVSNSSVSRR